MRDQYKTDDQKPLLSILLSSKASSSSLIDTSFAHYVIEALEKDNRSTSTPPQTQ